MCLNHQGPSTKFTQQRALLLSASWRKGETDILIGLKGQKSCIPVSSESVGAVASKGARFVDALSAVLAGRSLSTLVNVLIARLANESWGAVARVRAIDFVGLANAFALAWIGSACVVQVAEQACLAHWALTHIRSNLVDAGSSVVACVRRAVIMVGLTVFAYKNAIFS